MNHAKMSLAARRQKWLELVAEYRRRGISAALFCKEHGFHSRYVSLLVEKNRQHAKMSCQDVHINPAYFIGTNSTPATTHCDPSDCFTQWCGD